MTPNFEIFVSVLLPISCHIGWGMPFLCIFVEEVAMLLGVITDKWVSHRTTGCFDDRLLTKMTDMGFYVP